MSAAKDEIEVAAVWFLAARVMASSGAKPPRPDDAAAGLYALAILGVSEQACLEAKRSESFGRMTLVDCLAAVRRLPRDVAERILTGVLMIALAEANLQPLQSRWISLLSSAAGLCPEELHRCCASARAISATMRPRGDDA